MILWQNPVAFMIYRITGSDRTSPVGSRNPVKNFIFKININNLFLYYTAKTVHEDDFRLADMNFAGIGLNDHEHFNLASSNWAEFKKGAGNKIK